MATSKIMNELKGKSPQQITRDDIARLLKSIAPSEKGRASKISAVRELQLPENFQGHRVEDYLETYKEF